VTEGTTEAFSSLTRERTQDEPLHERELELARIEAVLADAQRGHGQLLLIEGPAGIGKTRLLQEAGTMADSRGFRVLGARGGELERDFGFGVVRQLLEPVLARVAPRKREELLSGAAKLAEPVFSTTGHATAAIGDPVNAVLHGLYWLIANLSERAPVLLAIDDYHWADGPSQRFLIYLARRLEGLRAAVVLAMRTGDPRAELELLRTLSLEAPQPVLRPDALSQGAVDSIVSERLGARADRRLCRACHEATGGNPFLLFELLRELLAGGRPLDEIDPATVKRLASQRIAAAILLRVGRLQPAAVDLCRAVAVLGESATPDAAAELAGLERSATAAIADSVVDAAVFQPGRPLRFLHPIVRAAIYAEIPSGMRSEMHSRAARVLAARDAPPESVAMHLVATDPAGDQAAVGVLRQAARAALSRGAPETASRYLRRALAEPPASQQRAEVRLELGAAATRAGEPGGVALMHEAFERAERQPERAAAGLQLATALLLPGLEIEPAIAVLERSLQGLDDPDLSGRIEALLLLAGLTTPTARRLMSDRIADARSRVSGRTGERAGVLRSLLAVDVLISDGDAARAATLAEQALAGGALIRDEVMTDMPFASPSLLVLREAGRLDAARRAAEMAVAESRGRGSPIVLARASAFRAFVRLRAGDLAGAEDDARACLELAAEPGRGIPHPLATSALASVLIERGDLRGARDALRQLDVGAYNPEVTPIQAIRETRARLWLVEGRPDAALEELLACSRWEEEWQASAGVVPVPWRSLSALAKSAQGATAQARDLAEREVELARRFGSPLSLGVALRALGAVADNANGIEPLEEAVGVLADSGARLEHAHALVDVGALLRRTGKRSAALERLLEGMDHAQRCGATALVAFARDELRLAGARPRRIASTGLHALTPAERRVAELAADGMHNKEIAQALFVTLRTVEMHLSNAYRKLEIPSREQLPRALKDPR
jgi:DNA-binding CsgD family transcriptional regulator